MISGVGASGQLNYLYPQYQVEQANRVQGVNKVTGKEETNEMMYKKDRTKYKKWGKRCGICFLLCIVVLLSVNRTEETQAKKTKERKVIGIDAGHQMVGNSSLEAIGPGAKTKKAKVAGGTTGRYTKVPEYKLTLSIAQKLKKELSKRGYDVVMTRTKNNVNISNKERAEKINKAKADICIRLHADGSSSTSVSGASVLYPSSKNKYCSQISTKSKKLARSVINSYCTKTGMKNRGKVVRDDLTGTNWSKVPVIVLEMGFMTNKQNDIYMQSKKGQDKMVQGIANGVDNYYK